MKLLALSNLFGRPWDTTRATYNQKIFAEISTRCELTLLVPVPWTEILKFPSQYFAATRATSTRWPFVRYFPYFYIPRLSQGINAYCLLLSVLLFCPYTVLIKNWDAILGSWIYPDSIVAVMLGRLRRKPSLAVALGTDINDVATRGLQKRQIQYYLAKSALVITVSQDLARKVLALGIDEAKVATIYNGVDSDSFRPQNKELPRRMLDLPIDKKVILFVGNLIKEKGCFELIYAFNEINKANPNCLLTLVGGGPIAEDLRKLAVEFDLSEKIRFVGKVSHDKLPVWFAAADLLCLPSYREGIPNVVMEALASGLPIVATHVGGIPEVVRSDCGILISPNDVGQLTDALHKVLSQTWDAAAISESVRQYTWSNTGKQYVDRIVDAVKNYRH
jgi:glycosyltransferase involved in cell wall biosynthesis